MDFRCRENENAAAAHCVTRTHYWKANWKESGGGYAAINLSAAKSGSKLFCRRVQLNSRSHLHATRACNPR